MSAKTEYDATPLRVPIGHQSNVIRVDRLLQVRASRQERARRSQWKLRVQPHAVQLSSGAATRPQQDLFAPTAAGHTVRQPDHGAVVGVRQEVENQNR